MIDNCIILCSTPLLTLSLLLLLLLLLLFCSSLFVFSCFFYTKIHVISTLAFAQYIRFLVLTNCFIWNTQELEALSSHYALLFNRRKTKLSAEQKSLFEGKLKEVQQIFDLSTEIDAKADSNKGKTVKRENGGSSDEIKNLHDSSVGKAAEMAAG